MTSSAVLRVVSPLACAMQARNVAAVQDAFAPDAVLHSPLTDGLVFRGRAQIGVLTSVLFEVLKDFRYTGEFVGSEVGFLMARARVGAEEIEVVDRFLVGPDGRIEEITIFFRPLPAAAAALRAIGSGLGRRKGKGMGAVMSVLTLPIVMVTRIGDGLGAGLIRRTL